MSIMIVIVRSEGEKNKGRTMLQETENLEKKSQNKSE